MHFKKIIKTDHICCNVIEKMKCCDFELLIFKLKLTLFTWHSGLSFTSRNSVGKGDPDQIKRDDTCNQFLFVSTNKTCIIRIPWELRPIYQFEFKVNVYPMKSRISLQEKKKEPQNSQVFFNYPRKHKEQDLGWQWISSCCIILWGSSTFRHIFVI